MHTFLRDLRTYICECWKTAAEFRERQRAMIGVLAGLLAFPIIWALGGKLELTQQGFVWVAAWATTSSLIALFVISPFLLWRSQRHQLLGRGRDVCTVGLLSLWFETGEVKTSFGVGGGIRLAERQENGLMVEFEKAIRPETLAVKVPGTKITIPLIERTGRRAVIDCSALDDLDARYTVIFEAVEVSK